MWQYFFIIDIRHPYVLWANVMSIQLISILFERRSGRAKLMEKAIGKIVIEN